MKRSKTILFIAVGLIAAILVGCIVFISSHIGKKSHEDGESTTDNDITVSIPDDSSDSEASVDDSIPDPPAITDPDDPNDSDATEPNDPTEDHAPKVEDGTREDVEDKIPEDTDTKIEDEVVTGEKDKDTVETGPASGEDRNDDLLKEKKDNVPPDEKEDKPAIVENEKTSAEGEKKGDGKIIDEENNADDSNKNAPEYKPSIGGDNPFDNNVKSEIDDKPVDEFIGDGEDRPGEGFHF